MTAAVVVLGSGLAGYNLAREFRKLDKETPLVVVTRLSSESALTSGNTVRLILFLLSKGLADTADYFDLSYPRDILWFPPECCEEIKKEKLN